MLLNVLKTVIQTSVLLMVIGDHGITGEDVTRSVVVVRKKGQEIVCLMSVFHVEMIAPLSSQAIKKSRPATLEYVTLMVVGVIGMDGTRGLRLVVRI